MTRTDFILNLKLTTLQLLSATNIYSILCVSFKWQSILQHAHNKITVKQNSIYIYVMTNKSLY